jgi:cation transport ATPase
VAPRIEALEGEGKTVVVVLVAKRVIGLIAPLGLKAVFLATMVLGVTSLWMAILADTGATVLVTANTLRLLRFAPSRKGGFPI